MVLVFAVTGAIVFWAGTKLSPRPDRFTASATVLVPDRPGLTPQAIERDVLAAQAYPDFAGADHTSPDPQTAASLADDPSLNDRGNLRITAELTAGSPQWRTTISYSGEEAARVLRQVNSLAERFAASERTAQATRAAATHSPAELDAAKTDLTEARTHLNGFLHQHFTQLQQRADRLQEAEPTTAAPKPPQTRAPQPPALVENPRWTELNDRITQLQKQRAALLLSRTAIHPSVQDLDSEVRQLQQQLGSIPRQIPNDPAAESSIAQREPIPAPPADKSPSPSLPAGFDWQSFLRDDTAAAQRYTKLRRSVDETEQHYQQVLAAPPSTSEPSVEIHLAEQCQHIQVAQGPRHLFLVALLAGLAMSTGVSMVSMGVAQPPLSTISQVQAALPVPVVGVISTEDSESAESAPSPLARFSRPVLILGGVALMVVCLVALAVLLG